MLFCTGVDQAIIVERPVRHQNAARRHRVDGRLGAQVEQLFIAFVDVLHFQIGVAVLRQLLDFLLENAVFAHGEEIVGQARRAVADHLDRPVEDLVRQRRHRIETGAIGVGRFIPLFAAVADEHQRGHDADDADHAHHPPGHGQFQMFEMLLLVPVWHAVLPEPPQLY